MREFNVCITDSFEDCTKDIQLVVFKNNKPYIPNEGLKQYVQRLGKYAAENDCLVVSPLYQENEYLKLCIINNTGEFLGEQSAICLNTRYLDEFKRLDEINIIDTKLGKIFLSVDVDIYRPEIVRLAAFKGCDIIISSQYFYGEDFSPQRILFGAWSEAQANCKFVISATNKMSSIILPCELTAEKGYSGFAASSYEGPVYGNIDLCKVEEAYKSFPVFDSMNPVLYKNNYWELSGK